MRLLKKRVNHYYGYAFVEVDTETACPCGLEGCMVHIHRSEEGEEAQTWKACPSGTEINEALTAEEMEAFMAFTRDKPETR